MALYRAFQGLSASKKAQFIENFFKSPAISTLYIVVSLAVFGIFEFFQKRKAKYIYYSPNMWYTRFKESNAFLKSPDRSGA